MRERGALERLMGNFSTPKILDFLSTFREFDYSINEIAKNSNVSSKTVRREIPTLCYYEIAIESRTVGKTKMYKFNADSTIAKALNHLISEIATFDIENTIEDEHLETTQNPRRVPRANMLRKTDISRSRKEKTQIKTV